MKAMIFAAGLGTRLRPLTDNCSKAMVEINGKPMIGHLIFRLHESGINEFVVNVHHHANMLENYLKSISTTKLKIDISDERDCLLETGGGLLAARDLLKGEEPILVHNVDIWSRFDINELIKAHDKRKPLATLAVSQRKTSRYFLFGKDNSLCGWKNKKTGEIKISKNIEENYELAFSGIQVLSQEFLQLLQGEGPFSIVDEYLRLAKNHNILCWEHPSEKWRDLGKPEAVSYVENHPDLI